MKLFNKNKNETQLVIHKDTSLLSIDEFKDNGIIEDEESSISQLESKAFEINSNFKCIYM